MPDLSALLPERGRLVTWPPEALRFSYYDTEDLRLTRAGVTLWFQRLTDGRMERATRTTPITDAIAPWMLARPMARPRSPARRPAGAGAGGGARHRLHPRAGTRLGRGAAHQPRGLPAARPQGPGAGAGDRRPDLGAGRPADQGQVPAAPSRRTAAATPPSPGRVVRMLRRAGASESGYRLPQLRALGEPAQAPADIPEPVPTRAGAGVSDILTNVLRRDVLRSGGQRLAVRLRGDDGVHRMRVAARRLRSDITHLPAAARQRLGGPHLAPIWPGSAPPSAPLGTPRCCGCACARPPTWIRWHRWTRPRWRESTPT